MAKSKVKKRLDTRRARSSGSARSIINEHFASPKFSMPVRTGRRPGVVTGTADPFPEPPEDWLGTRPEWAIFWAHSVLKRKPFEDFQYIDHIAGIQVDFLEFDLNIALNIQGLFWHYFFSGAKQGEDIITKSQIESTGTILINIDEDHCLADPVYYLRQALQGIDHSRSARGSV
jgi:hypothetical protein